MASGVWSQEESSLHINMLEMKAVFLALVAFLPRLSGQSVVLMSLNCHGCRLPPESGQQSVLCPVSHGRQVSALDRAPFGLPDGQVYSREEECSGRSASSHGMIPSSKGVQGDLRGVQSSPSQPFCHPHQDQASSLCLSGSGPDGMEA